MTAAEFCLRSLDCVDDAGHDGECWPKTVAVPSHEERRAAALEGDGPTYCIRCGQLHTGKGVVCNACDVGAG